MTDTFKAFLVTEQDGAYRQSVVERNIEDLPAGEVLIEVEYSSVNYKDALSSSGNKGVTRSYPHTPGIDAAGVVASSDDTHFQRGDKVLVMGYDLGMNVAGGFAEYVRVPSDWVIHRPENLSAEDAMVFGTAGFTASMCVDTLLQVGIDPEQGPVLVTGASGGVGSIAVWLLSNLGFDVIASTGKAGQEAMLKALGAKEIVMRDSLLDNNKRPMNKPVWAAAIDTVGGPILSNILKSIRYGGSVACCGMVAGGDINTSVFPFILRGVNLLGVDSVELPLDVKQDIWNIIGSQWLFDNFAEFKQSMCTTISLDQLPEAISQILKGAHIGRYLVKIA